MATMRAPWALSSSICQACRQRLLPVTHHRSFSTTPKVPAEEDAFGDMFKNVGRGGQMGRNNRPRGSDRNQGEDPFRGQSITGILDADANSLLTSQFASNLNLNNALADQPHRLHVYTTRHNTHITFVQPTRPASQTPSSGISGTSASASEMKKQVDVLLSLSTGNIGFRKAGRGSYDAAYQLAAFVLRQIQEKGMMRDVQKLEVVLRGYGAGREAVTKTLLGTEGHMIRRKITAVIDATRIKQGGPRGKKPRRLG